MPLGREVDAGPSDTVLDGDPAPLKKGHSTPSFRPMSIVAKRSPISATGELLFVHVAYGRGSVLVRQNPKRKGQFWGFSSPMAMHRNAFPANKVMQQKGSFYRCQGVMGVHSASEL